MALIMEANLILGEGNLCQLLCFLFIYFPFSACLFNTAFITRHILLYLKYSFVLSPFCDMFCLRYNTRWRDKETK